MNSLTNGFIYATGVSWLLCEVCISASNGSWMPFTLFWIGFVLMFSILGCLRISDRAVETAGPVFGAIIGIGIALYGVGSFGGGEGSTWSNIGALARLVGGAAIVLLSFFAFVLAPTRQDSH